jgi:hypothetical protein
MALQRSDEHDLWACGGIGEIVEQKRAEQVMV